MARIELQEGGSMFTFAGFRQKLEKLLNLEHSTLTEQRNAERGFMTIDYAYYPQSQYGLSEIISRIPEILASFGTEPVLSPMSNCGTAYIVVSKGCPHKDCRLRFDDHGGSIYISLEAPNGANHEPLSSD